MRRSGFVILWLALALGGLGLANDPEKRDEVRSPDGSRGPLEVVKSSVARLLTPRQSRRPDVNGSEERRAEIRRVARDLLDVDEMARRALGQHWKALQPEERSEFVRLFREMPEQFLVTVVERYAGERVAFLGNEVTGAYARVHSRVMPRQGAETSIEYCLFESGSRWAVYDIVFEGRSLVSNYRSEFDAILRASPFPQLLERMRTEQSTRRQPGGTVVTLGAIELEPSERERWAAGLLLGAALYGRRR